MLKQNISRRLLCRWAGWFFIVNVFIYFFIALNYLFYLPDFNSIPFITIAGVILGWVFILVALLGQSALFAFLCFLPVLVLILGFPRRWLAFTVAALVNAVMAFFLLADALVYHVYHYHLAGVVWTIIRLGVFNQVLELSWIEWSSVFVIGFFIVSFEISIAFYVWRKVNKKTWRHSYLFSLVFSACLYLSYTLTLATTIVIDDVRAQTNNHIIVMERQIIPYYSVILSLLLPGKGFRLVLETRDNGFFIQNSQVTKPLNYPLHPLRCRPLQKHYNIVIIVLDAWRSDMLNPKITPNIYRFSKKSWVFKDNLSGGNCTQPGIFSLFYSIPANYWTSVLKQHRSPVFIHQLLKDHYTFGIFRSASLHYPAFDKTVFSEIKKLQIVTPGNESFDRDRRITKEFKDFIHHVNSKNPFFSFVFYDETHNYCESSADYPKPFRPAIQVCNRLFLNNATNPLPYLNRYRNAVHFVDALVGQILKVLKVHQLLKNTIVIITADHGEEFNENHQNYWGHASDYTRWQIHTPLIVYWPFKRPKVFNYLTSHYDLIPTLMQVLNCQNPVTDYSVGKLLTERGSRFPLIVNSYIDYAIINQKRVTRIYPEGNYIILNPNGKPIPNASLNIKSLKDTFNILNKFFYNHWLPKVKSL